ncbi:hypothetical protein [Rubrivirga sp.]|uniref:hypothetical protein n=1 Tax=Rubrivirga sp. TaxID=1885344 RepID=UPI003B5300A1
MTRRALAVLLALAALPASAQVERSDGPAWCRLPVSTWAAPSAAARVARPVAPDCDPATEGVRFEVSYTGFPPEAEGAFQAAVDTWACRVRSDQVVRVSATWEPLAATTLGSAGPFLYRNFGAAPTRDVWYPAALADALSGRDLGDGEADIEALFNSDFDDWHLGPGPPPPDLYDLYTVVLHELGHGLGLIGSLEVEGGLGFVGREPEGAFTYDLHTQTPAGVSLLDSDVFPDGSAALASALQAEVRFVGRAVEQVAGRSVALYAPPRWVQGGSYSHLDEETFAAGTPDGLMTPFIARGETVAEPGKVVCAMIADVGWTLAGRCAEQVGELPAVEPRVVATRRGPNPTTGRTTVTLTSQEPVSVRVALVDVLGRRVADFGRIVLVSGRTEDVVIDGGALASGVYVLTVLGGPEPVTLPLAVVR